MENKIELPETSTPEQGRVLSVLNVTPETLERARSYVMGSKENFEGQRQDWERKNRMRDRAWRAILEPPRSKQTAQDPDTTLEGRAYQGFDDKASPLVHDNVEASISY